MHYNDNVLLISIPLLEIYCCLNVENRGRVSETALINVHYTFYYDESELILRFWSTFIAIVKISRSRGIELLSRKSMIMDVF